MDKIPTDAAIVRAYEYIVTQNKKIEIICLYVVMKSHCNNYLKQYFTILYGRLHACT